MPDELQPIWDRVREELRRDVPDFKFHIWLEPLQLAAVSGDTLFVRAPDHIRSWVRDRYLELLSRAAARGFKPDAAVEIVSNEWEPPPLGVADRLDPGGREALRLRPKYCFDEFVIGPGNRFAHAASLAAAELPGQAYNPLFIHGRPGLGKTHLLHAIGNYVHRYGGGLRVRYTTIDEFTAEFVTAIRGRDMTAFKDRFRNLDVLLVDDVQFLADKTRTEEELFHTFNALHDRGRQLVLTSDRSPDELAGLEERIGARFASGLVVGLEAPDIEVRRAILEKRARLDAVDADAELLEEIAGRVTTSVRALEAALIQVVAYASIRGERPTAALARRLLERVVPQPTPTPFSINAILSATAIHFDVEAEHLVARNRRPAVARARKVAMYLTRELTAKSLPEIGRGFGARDHSTVLHALRSVTRDLDRDPELALAVKSLRARLQQPL